MTVHNLPAQPTIFIGREPELADIAKRLSDPACRLLTLVGPGGIGKTRLAIEAARHLVDAVGTQHAVSLPVSPFPGGVHFVSLQPLNSPDFIVSTIADALGFTLYGEGAPKTQLLHYLREKRLLLILDNFEHLVDGADLLPEILDNAPGVKLLVTSRERLRLREEWAFNVIGLPFPDNGQAAEVNTYSAVELFMQHVRRAGYTPSDADMPAVIHICQMVEGSPLALELAAAWVRVMPCAEIAREIERSLDILATTTRNMPEKHRSVRATFEQSWKLLTDEEQAVFRRLSVFRGGFTREAAEQVAGSSLPILVTLVDKSLVRVGASGRYDVHELMRQYGEEQLNAAGDMSAICDAHLVYFSRFMDERQKELYGDLQREGLNKIEGEIDNVRTAFRRAVDQGKLREIHQMADSLWIFYEIRCWYQESEQIFRHAVEGLRARPHDSEMYNRALGFCLALQGWSLVFLHQFNAAQEALYESAALLRPLPIGKEHHRVLVALSELPIDAAERMQYTQEALTIARSLNFQCGMAVSLSYMSEIAFDQGNYTDAKKWGDEALILMRQFQNQYGASCILRQLSLVVRMDNQLAEARQLAQEAVAVAEAINFPRGALIAFRQLGRIAHAERNYAEAKEHYLRSILLARSINYARGLVPALVGYAYAANASGDLREAWEYFQQALRVAYEIGSASTLMYVFSLAAEYLASSGSKELAAEVSLCVISSPESNAESRNRVEGLLNKLGLAEDGDAVVQDSRTLDDIVSDILEMSPMPDKVRAYPDPQSLADPLSERELEILRLIADGLSTNDVAQKLFLTVGTVRWYLNQIYSKLYVHGRVQAVARARELKLLA